MKAFHKKKVEDHRSPQDTNCCRRISFRFGRINEVASRDREAVFILFFKITLRTGKIKKIGDAGYRSPYLSHAKRALYHLSYIPFVALFCSVKYFDFSKT